MRSPMLADDLADAKASVAVVELDGTRVPEPLVALIERAAPLPWVSIGLSEQPSPAGLSSLVDVVITPDDRALQVMLDSIAVNPIAATTLALLLRGGARRSIAEGLVAESAAYSTLQAGSEFATWRTAHPPRARPSDPAPSVIVQRKGDELHLTLSRPAVRNALNTAMRDELTAACAIVDVDASITRVHLAGEGPSFCSGGDLDEFGSLPDPATAHLVRLRRSPALALARIAPRVVVNVHGACFGSGVELAAFGRHVIAHPDTTMALPELGMGLIPGAGGTASIARRIGRHRTALLALTGTSIDVETALLWGLVDEIQNATPDR